MLRRLIIEIILHIEAAGPLAVLIIMADEDTKFDVAVVGAGPAGMMAAGRAAELGIQGTYPAHA